jgi:hypothetical protein
MKWDTVIVGSGPAGMFAAYELTGSILVVDMGKDVSDRVCPMKSGNDCISCVPCDILSGVGGAGTFSDGILNLRYDIGGDLSEFVDTESIADQLVEYVDEIFGKFGVSSQIYKCSDEAIEDIGRKAAGAGVKFINIPQKHIGSENSPSVIKKFRRHLEKNKNVKFMLNTEVTDLLIDKGVCYGVRVGDTEIRANHVLIAPGRVGASWVDKLVRRYKIDARYAPIDVGVRVEVPSIIMESITKINRDPKFHILTTEYDDFVRTFCTNPNGFVVKEKYENFIGVNGHSLRDIKSQNTNFAFLVRVELTEPLENTTLYGKSIAELATTIGGGKPIVQRMGDLRRGSRSTWRKLSRNLVKNTLTDVTPGDISMALPHRILVDIVEGLEKLDKIIPGVSADSTLLYAPEIKFYAMRLAVNKNMETSIKNLFAAGDGTGLSRDLINAAATGILAARGIIYS